MGLWPPVGCQLCTLTPWLPQLRAVLFTFSRLLDSGESVKSAQLDAEPSALLAVEPGVANEEAPGCVCQEVPSVS